MPRSVSPKRNVRNSCSPHRHLQARHARKMFWAHMASPLAAAAWDGWLNFVNHFENKFPHNQAQHNEHSTTRLALTAKMATLTIKHRLSSLPLHGRREEGSGKTLGLNYTTKDLLQRSDQRSFVQYCTA
jgi:hypothetical protein